MNKLNSTFVALALIASLLFSIAAQAQTAQWPEQRANDWYAHQPWLVGSNYIPRDAINQLEMWQADSFNPSEIDQELGWAEAMGMNTMRVFLHDLLWQENADAFRARIDQFLAIAARHHIRPLLVLFDSCWDPAPHLGRQHAPVPGVHNSGWVQSPAVNALADEKEYPRLHMYVKGVIGAFANDDRILGWDVWNEPGSDQTDNYPKTEMKNDKKVALIEKLLPQVFAWAREANPSQPLTSGVYSLDISKAVEDQDAIEKIQLRQSDIITFHNYSWPEWFREEVEYLRRFDRPIICTEYMARSAGSTFDGVLPVAKQEHVGDINWGFVKGKTQTTYPWESWRHPYVNEQPMVWFHDILRADGTPYRQAEVDLIRQLTGKK
jgi:hypothetical protein